tara:strand:+ start:64 stop:975 length:912 start_codon:yes stop_codon:yes gene_type:complete
MRKQNYLNNRDILKEIHKSKKTYCKFTTPEDGDFDIILPGIGNINKTNTAEGRKLRAERLGRAAFDDAQLESTVKLKLDEFKVNTRDVPATDVVFRIMTFEHVPIDLTGGKKKKKEIKELFVDVDQDSETSVANETDEDKPVKFTKCNFPPFFHYKINNEGEPYLVGKSHWKGELDTGEFCKEHGTMTNKLAHMFMKLCERYATRSNWRGYTYNDEMRSQALLQLAQIGLQFDESKSQNPFAYYTAAITNSFTRVLNIEKRNQNIRDDILEMNNLTPSYTRQGQTGWGKGGKSSGTYSDGNGE